MLLTGVTWGSIADWVSGLATLMATVVALYLGLKKPDSISFGIDSGMVFSITSAETNNKSHFRKVSITLSLLNVFIVNNDNIPKVITETGFLVKGNFRRQVFSTHKLDKINYREVKYVDFGRDKHGLGHIVTLQSHSFNPFISKKKIAFRVYVKDTGGKVYKSQYFIFNSI